MNVKLKNEIIKHIFEKIGCLSSKSSMVQIMQDEFLLDKRIVFASEDKDYQRKTWAITGEFDKLEVKMLVADISDEYNEVALLFQMSKFPVYALRMSGNPDDSGSFYFHSLGKWVEAGTEIQAKFLYGVEGLGACFIGWQKLKNYKDLYEELISFLKFIEQ